MAAAAQIDALPAAHCDREAQRPWERLLDGCVAHTHTGLRARRLFDLHATCTCTAAPRGQHLPNCASYNKRIVTRFLTCYITRYIVAASGRRVAVRTLHAALEVKDRSAPAERGRAACGLTKNPSASTCDAAAPCRRSARLTMSRSSLAAARASIGVLT